MSGPFERPRLKQVRGTYCDFQGLRWVRVAPVFTAKVNIDVILRDPTAANRHLKEGMRQQMNAILPLLEEQYELVLDKVDPAQFGLAAPTPREGTDGRTH